MSETKMSPTRGSRLIHVLAIRVIAKFPNARQLGSAQRYKRGSQVLGGGANASSYGTR